MRLLNILQTKRPAGSKEEQRMIDTYISPYKPSVDTAGNNIITVYKPDGRMADTLFSCHTDTVHAQGGKQIISIATEQGKNIVTAKDSNCLGADDGAGVYIMLCMIDSKVPGTYVFHRKEEIGGIGSTFIKNTRSNWLRTFSRAIAFDRKGKTDVIIKQGVGQIASNEFGEALANALNTGTGFTFNTANKGSFTDVANYYEYINECVNISVGYERQHSAYEILDICFINKLIARLININWEGLPTKRKAEKIIRPKPDFPIFIDDELLTVADIAYLVRHQPKAAIRLIQNMEPSVLEYRQVITKKKEEDAL